MTTYKVDEATGDVIEPTAAGDVRDAPIAATSKTYRALTGIDYPGGRVEEGDTVSDLPAESVNWLLASACITEDLSLPQLGEVSSPLDVPVEPDNLPTAPVLADTADPEPNPFFQDILPPAAGDIKEVK